MKNVSEEFKNITKKIKQQNVKLSILDENELTVSEVNMLPIKFFDAMPLRRLKAKKQVIAKEVIYSFDGQLFKTIMKQIEITVKNAKEIKDKHVSFKYGLLINNEFEYVDLGSYYIKDVEDDKKKEEITVTGYDKMINFMKTFKQSDLKITYPCTLLQLVQKICEVCGVKLYSTNFFNSDLIVDDDFFTAQELTYRDVLEKIAQATLTTAFIKNDKLYFSKIEKTQVQKLDKSYITNLIIKEKFGPVNALILGRGDVEDNIEEPDNESIAKNGRCEIRFDENELVQYKREQVIKNMFQQIDGLEYYSFEASDIGVMWLDPCDVIELSDREDTTYNSIYLKAHIVINTGITSDIEADIIEETNTEYKVTTKEQKKQLKVERLAKKHEGLIQDLIKETSEHEEKMTEVLQTVDKITQKVENEIDITREVTETKKIVLENCMAGELLELEIYGNNSVFDYLLPSDDLLSSDDLLPYGDSTILVNGEEIDLGITEKLRQKGIVKEDTEEDIKDIYKLKDNKAEIVRKIGVLESGETYILDKEKVEDLGQITIPLKEGTNTIEIKNYVANLKARFVIKNDYTNKLASTTIELKSVITQMADNINLIVSKKLNKEDIIAAINMAVLKLKGEEVSEEEVEKSIIQLFANVLEINADNYSLSQNGYMKALLGEIAGWIFTKNFFYKNYKVGDEDYQCGLYSSDNADDIFLYAGAKVPGLLKEANTYISKNGLVCAKWFRVNGENGFFYVDHANGSRALVLTNHGIDKYLSNGNRWSYLGIVYRNGVPSTEGVFLYDAQGFELIDGLHGNITVFKVGYIDEGCTSYYDFKVNGKLFANSDFLVSGNANVVKNSGPNESTAVERLIISGNAVQVFVRNGSSFLISSGTSDRRLKKNIKPTEIESSLEIIKQFIFKSYDWIFNKEHRKIGLIAQDVEKIDDNLVLKVKQDEGSKYKELYQLNSDELQMHALKAIQELDKIVEELSEENKKLKQQLEAQQKTIDFLINKLNCKDELDVYLKGEENVGY